MSLFPSASCQKSSDSNKTQIKWLENKSFASDAAALLNAEHKTLDSAFSSCDASIDVTNIKEENQETSSESNSDQESNVTDEPFGKIQVLEIEINKTPNKDNLYFKRPYKVKIPKYYRSSLKCLGLSSQFTITFDKKRKSKRKVKDAFNTRYYKMDSKLLFDDQEENGTQSYKACVENLNVKTREDPSNIEAWLRLVALQDDLPGKNVKLKTEKKVAILDKAISSNPRDHKLKLKRLEFLESIAEDTDRDWKNLVFHHPECQESWTAYVNHTLTSSRFTVSRTAKVFEKCFETLNAIRKQSHRTEEFSKSMEADMLSMLRKLVRFLAEAGHTERVVTLLILMLEINVRSRTEKDLDDVQHFYESGVPLLGQTDSEGWEKWHRKFERGGWVDADSTKVSDSETDEDIDHVIDFDQSVNENWLKMECERGRRDLLPMRSDLELEDPARKVAYDDVKGFLFLIYDDRNRIRILEMLLHALGAVPENDLISSKFLLSQPCCLTHACQYNDVLGDVSPLQKVTCSSCSLCGALPRTPHHELLQTIFEQLAAADLSSVRRDIASLCVGYHVIRTSFLSARPELKAELKKTYKEARKLAKAFLKEDPGDYLAWAKLARIEHAAKKADESRKILYNSLCMCKEQAQALMLSRSYSELMHQSDKDSVKLVLSALGDDMNFPAYLQTGKTVSSAIVLRASRSLERLCEDLGCVYEEVETNSSYEPSSFASVLFCFVLYGIVTSCRVTPDVFRKYILILRKAKNNGSKQAPIDLRFIHEFNVSLATCDYHRNNAYRRALLSALDDVPDYPPFLIKLCQIEIGCSLTSVMRRYLTLSNPILVFFSAYFELLRSEQIDESLVPPRVLNVLERSLTTHSDCILLWRMFTKLSNNPEVALTRAAASCPWSKALACDRIRLGKEKIEDVLVFMQDKGLRLRTPVEEVTLLLAL